MTMTELDVWVWLELQKGHNPMFTIGELCRKLSPNSHHDGSVHDDNYRRMQYSISKFEKFGLLHVYRVVNGGTVIMLKVRAM